MSLGRIQHSLQTPDYTTLLEQEHLLLMKVETLGVIRHVVIMVFVS